MNATGHRSLAGDKTTTTIERSYRRRARRNQNVAPSFVLRFWRHTVARAPVVVKQRLNFSALTMFAAVVGKTANR
jgi:hypothetical protein